jgi:hypothetical protein
MRTAEIRVMDLNSAQVFQGYQVDWGEWHLSGVNYTGVVIAHEAAQVAGMIAHIISDMRMYSVESHWYETDGKPFPKWIHVYPDPLHNAYLHGQYLSSAEWLRAILETPIPKDANNASHVADTHAT